MRIVVATTAMNFAGRAYVRGDEIPVDAMPSQRHLEALVSARRVRVEIDESEQVDGDGNMVCAHCGRGSIRGDVALSLHLWFAHGVQAPRVSPRLAPEGGKGSKRSQKARAAA
jgi:hypothetical protein